MCPPPLLETLSAFISGLFSEHPVSFFPLSGVLVPRALSSVLSLLRHLQLLFCTSPQSFSHQHRLAAPTKPLTSSPSSHPPPPWPPPHGSPILLPLPITYPVTQSLVLKMPHYPPAPPTGNHVDLPSSPGSYSPCLQVVLPLLGLWHPSRTSAPSHILFFLLGMDLYILPA